MTDDTDELTEEHRLETATMQVNSSYKVLGQLDDGSGVGVLGQNDASNGTPVGVEGAVPNSTDGYGLATSDDVRIEGTVDTNDTDFVVEAGSTARSDATNVVLGHASNTVQDGAVGATIGGGGQDDGTTPDPNVVADDYGTVAGGRNNFAGDSDGNPGTDTYATVGGGLDNKAKGSKSVIAGGEGNEAKSLLSVVGGGVANVVSSQGGAILAGNGNEVRSDYGTVGGGEINVVDGGKGTISGGRDNWAGFSASVGGGKNNRAFSSYDTIGGGKGNRTGTSGTTEDLYATIGGGKNNEATDEMSTVPGGQGNTASGKYSMAAGRYAAADLDWTFVWNDGSGASDSWGALDDQFAASTSDSNSDVGGNTASFHVKATNGIRFITATDNSKVTWIPDNTAGWSSACSRAVKTNVEPTDPVSVLDRLVEMDISTWEYTDEDDGGTGVRHMGPMAEDFHDAFELGTGETGINSINADGVAFAAIQGLAERLADARERLDRRDERVATLESEVQSVRTENQSLRETNEHLRERLAAVESHVGLDGDPGTASADD